MVQTRRNFLKNTFAFAGATVALPALFPRSIFAQGMSGASNTGRILVIVQMMGGNDGINTVIPFMDSAYHHARPTLGYSDTQVLAIDNSPVAFHPRMTALDKLYKEGHVAVIQGVGYPHPDLSHFRSTEIWQRADPTDTELTGWLGRFLDEEHDRMLVDQGISIGTETPLHLASDKGFVASVEDVNQFQVGSDQVYLTDRQNQLSALEQIYGLARDEPPFLQFVRTSSSEAVQETFRLQNAIKNSKSKATYPATGFGNSMRQISQLILGGASARIFNATIGGFDNHADQKNEHANLLGELSDTLAAFALDLQNNHRLQDVMVLTFSEFGRRVQENGSQGTDHGTASVLFAVGGGLTGGLYGSYPSLSNLDYGNLKFSTDFRSVYATVLDKWLGADADAILGSNESGQAFARLGFV